MEPNEDALINAMDAFRRGARPAGFGEPRHWYVLHPETRELFPLKGVWGLATGRNAREVSTSEARRQISHAAPRIECVRLNGPPIDADDEEEWGEEGEPVDVLQIGYERSSRLRQRCIDYNTEADGAIRCVVCKIDFGERYGDIGRGFIHVHHLTPLAEIAERHRIDPTRDLVPVCPNCHAMLHRRTPPIPPDELTLA